MIFKCPKCNGTGERLLLEIDWETREVSATPSLKLCPTCEGSGIVDSHMDKDRELIRRVYGW